MENHLRALEIDSLASLFADRGLLKRQYHKLALKHHPDKNGNTTESNTRFREIQSAYETLSVLLDDDDMYEREANTEIFKDQYVDVLRDFLRHVFEGKYTDTLYDIIQKILDAGKKVSLQAFDDLDREAALSIYTFLSTYRSILHLSSDTLQVLRDLVAKKYTDVVLYKLNPTLTDMYNNHFYKLLVEEQVFLVPLWHPESYFEDKNANELIVLCEPDLPPEVTIDEENNVFVSLSRSGTELLGLLGDDAVGVSFDLGNHTFCIPFEQIRFVKEQVCVLKGQGLSRCHGSNLYNVDDRADLFVQFHLLPNC